MQKIEMAFSEIYEVLHFLDKELIEKIPLSVMKFIEDGRDKEYKVILNPNLSLEEQNLSVETYNILGVLKLKYWCESDVEKQKMVSIINKNEFEYEKLIREKYNPNNIFNKKQKDEVKSVNNGINIIEYKESLFTKLLKRIKSIFRKSR